MSRAVIGQPIDRVDGRLKVTGGARYAAEMPVANVAHGVLVMSQIARGRIADIDVSFVESMPGVIGVMTHLNAPEVVTPAAGRRLNLLQDDVVRYSNQPIGVVVGETIDAATYAASMIKVAYEVEPPITQLESELPRAFTPAGGGRGGPVSKHGDVTVGLAEAATRLERVYTTPTENHNPMEPHATIAVWDDDELTLYDSTQGVHNDRRNVATWLGLPVEKVRVVAYFVGGGFGCKGTTWSHVVLTAMAARQFGRPVKLALTRRQMYGPVGFRSQTLQTVTLGARGDGALTALRHTGVSQTSMFDDFTESVGLAARMLYACPNIETSHQLVRLNSGTPTFMRAPGEATGTFALESALDELAYELKLDPIELRLRNHADVDPESGRPWSSKSLRECYRVGAEQFGWSRRSPTPRSMRDGDTLIGLGMATATYPARRVPASARARVLPDGTAAVVSGSQDIGTGTYTVMAQVAAEALGLPFERVRFDLGDTRLPNSPNSGGSVTAASVSAAVHEAATAARQRLIELAVGDAASPLHGAEPTTITVEDGVMQVIGAPDRRESYQSVIRPHGLDRVEAAVNSEPSDEREKYASHTFGAVFAEVRVDPDLGQIRATRLLGAYGVGRVLNAKTARSQMIGGIIYGLGMALFEHTITDVRSGRVMNADFAEYKVPTNADTPPIDVIFVDEYDGIVSPIGVKGIGEIGTTGVAGAIANAVYHATGVRVRDLPITLDKALAI